LEQSDDIGLAGHIGYIFRK